MDHTGRAPDGPAWPVSAVAAVMLACTIGVPVAISHRLRTYREHFLGPRVGLPPPDTA
jgi:hypothetical protein